MSFTLALLPSTLCKCTLLRFRILVFLLCPTWHWGNSSQKTSKAQVSCFPHDILCLGEMAQAQSPTDKLELEMPGASSASLQNHALEYQGLASIGLQQRKANCSPEENCLVVVGSLQTGGDPGWLPVSGSGHKR